jgi:hypothetical protein
MVVLDEHHHERERGLSYFIRGLKSEAALKPIPFP